MNVRYSVRGMAVAVVLAMTGPAGAATDLACGSLQLSSTTELHTGKTAAAPGDPDTRWTVADSPDGPRVARRVRPVPGAWTSSPFANWISTSSSGGDATNAPGGYFVYSTSFTLPLLSTSSLVASVATDNEVTIRLNGTGIFFAAYPAHGSTTSFGYSGPLLRPGENRLEAIVHNLSPSPEGLLLAGDVASCFPVV